MKRPWLLVLLLTGCPSDQRAANSGAGARAEVTPATGDRADGAAETNGSMTPTEEHAIAVADANRFVREDLDRFLKEHPDALREGDQELFQTCRGDACLQHGVSKSVTPFMGTGVRYLVPLWLRGCLSGSADACLYAGRTYQGSQFETSAAGRVHEGWDKQALQTRFRLYIDRACKLDDTRCEQWADFTLGDESPPVDDAKLAIQRLKEGCARGAHGSCEALARHADEHPAIGEALEWWRQACEHEPKAQGRACSNYADALLATGDPGDRAKAVEALGSTCDPTAELWAKKCKGDPITGEEACDSVFVHSRGHVCVRLADTLPDDEALRLVAAMCVGSLIDETNAVGAKACGAAARLAKRMGKSKAYQAAIAKRACEVEEMDCLSTTYDLKACGGARKGCEDAAAP